MNQPDNAPVRFKPGQDVIHKTLANAPLMSVVEVERNTDRIKGKKVITGISCCWFDEKGGYHREPFHSNTLRHATPEEVAHIKARAVVDSRLTALAAK